MTLTRRKLLWAAPAAAGSQTLLSACGGNLGTQSSQEVAAKAGLRTLPTNPPSHP